MVQPDNMQLRKGTKEHPQKSIKHLQTIQTHDSQTPSQSTLKCSTQIMLTKWQICFHHGKVHGEGGCAVHVMYQSTQNIIYI